MTHTSTEQPEALRLATGLSGGKLIDDSTEWADTLLPQSYAASTHVLRSWKSSFPPPRQPSRENSHE